ncbi:unnamed protein product [Prunus brigantina]
MFFNISRTLKGLANKFGLAVVVTNQVVDFIGPRDGVNGVRLGNLESLDTSGRRVNPAFGLAWAHCINSRVFLARHEQSIGVNIRNAPSTTICSQTHRTFHLVFAPHLAYASAEFVITKEMFLQVLLLWPAEPHLEHFLLMVPSPCEGILIFFCLPGMTLEMGGSTTRLRTSSGISHIP